jgi:hypothetical protein
MNGIRARECRRAVYGSENPRVAEEQIYAYQVRKDGPTGAWVLVGKRAKYKALKRAVRGGLYL